jgi:hypothetical protein
MGWEAYCTTYGNDIKMSDPSGLIENREDHDSYYGSTSAYKIRSAIKTELDLLNGPLLHLQGTVVPQVYGRYVTKKSDGKDVRAILMKDGGDPIKPADLLLHEKRVVS